MLFFIYSSKLLYKNNTAVDKVYNIKIPRGINIIRLYNIIKYINYAAQIWFNKTFKLYWGGFK